MTDITFHFGAPDRVAYTCRLLRKATARGARLLVRADAAVLQALDVGLWALGPTAFITHCGSQADARLRQRSSVLLHPAHEVLNPELPILVNLADDVPDGFAHFERVIEIVSTDEADRQRARQRWRHYTAQGLTITRHDVQGRATE